MNGKSDSTWIDQNQPLVVVLAILGVFVFISVIVLIFYCYKQRKNKLESDMDKGLVDRPASVSINPKTYNSRNLSINAHKKNNTSAINNESTEHLDSLNSDRDVTPTPGPDRYGDDSLEDSRDDSFRNK